MENILFLPVCLHTIETRTERFVRKRSRYMLSYYTIIIYNAYNITIIKPIKRKTTTLNGSFYSTLKFPF